ncbi:hypothetical protein TIFTF001_022241, partial [Ficus carica]
MALSPFSLIPSSSSTSCSCKYASSHSLHFLLLLYPKTHFSVTSRASKFRISCSQRIDQADTEQRKKRKPRPSFLEQIQDKWSAKIGSDRDKFPWQEESSQLEQEGDKEEETVTETETETEIEVKESLS